MVKALQRLVFLYSIIKMTGKKNNPIMGFLFLVILSVFLMPYISSCGKGGQASSIASNTQLEVLNLSPDVEPVNLYIDYILQNTTPFTYPYPSGYFYPKNLDTPLQIRSAALATANLITIDQNFQPNHKYTLFITGQYSGDSTVTAILTEDDSTATPNVGFGKIRYINLSIPNTPLDVIANGTTVFPDALFEIPTAYKQVPVGNYIFQFVPTGTNSILTTTLPSTTIQDGRLYTLYSYGIVGRTDTSAFNAGVLINR